VSDVCHFCHNLAGLLPPVWHSVPSANPHPPLQYIITTKKKNQTLIFFVYEILDKFSPVWRENFHASKKGWIFWTSEGLLNMDRRISE
jgi:hypothetical protein